MKLFCVLLLSMASPFAMALVPVIDVKSIIGTLRNIEAIEKMKALAHDDMGKLREEFNALNPLHFKTDDLSSHGWSADSWQSALGGSGQAMKASLQQFKDNNPDLYEFSSQAGQSEEVRQAVKTDSILETESTQEYDRLKQYQTDINVLSNQIPTAASTKAALDINNKLLTQIAYLQVEMIHMQVIASQAAVWRMHRDLKSAASTNQLLGTNEEKS